MSLRIVLRVQYKKRRSILQFKGFSLPALDVSTWPFQVENYRQNILLLLVNVMFFHHLIFLRIVLKFTTIMLHESNVNVYC